MAETLAPEALVNVVTQANQRIPDAAALTGGGSVVSWIDDSSGSAVGKLRVYGADGHPVTGEITLGAAREVAVAATTSGGFVAVRIHEIGTQQNDIVAQGYDAAGAAVGPPTTVASVDVRSTPTLGYVTRGLEVAGLTDGGYVAGWSIGSFDSIGRTSASVAYQVVSPTGTLEGRGGAILASGRTALAYDAHIAFAEGPGGQVAASWWQTAFFEAGAALRSGQIVQPFDLAGQPLGPARRLDIEMPADGPTVEGQGGLSIAAVAGGKVAFAWVGGGVVWTAVYDLTAGAGVRTAPVRVSTLAVGAGEPQAVALEDGRYVVGWSQDGDVMSQVFSAAGAPAGGAQRLGTVTSGVQDQLKLASDKGVLVAAWQDASGLGFDQFGTGVKREIVAFDLIAQGTAGRDTLTGGPLGDSLSGRDGDDSLSGGGGGDTLSGGVGGDVFVGGSGDDSLSGGGGPDFVDYSDAPGDVTVDLSAGFSSGVGFDRLAGIESVLGSRFGDRLTGDFLINGLSAGAGDDTVNGDLGDDVLDGGPGEDTLVLLGSAETYFATGASAATATLVGRLGTVIATGFERVQAGGATLTWSAFTGQAFDGLRYIASNPDLISAFGADAARGRAHWTTTGQGEGRNLATFDPLRYAASNPDLLGQFGTDTEALIRHYITTGFAAGRSAIAFDPLQYGAANEDLLRAFGVDLAALTRHYAIAGVLEGRPKDGFDPLLYGASNDDLARLYGTDAGGLFQHWIRSGVYEGRLADSFDPLQYAAANDDLARVFGTDTRAALNHYLVAGADEGRATFSFDVTAYKLTFPDLVGLSNEQLLSHWLTTGADEGRRGDELFGREQSGTDQQLDPSAAGELRNFTTGGRFSSDRDYFVVGSTQAERITFTVEDAAGALADARLEIYDLDGRLVAFDVDTGASDVATVTVNSAGATVFYAVVSSVSGGEGTYSVVAAKSALLSIPDEGWLI